MLPQRLRLPLRKESEFFNKAKRCHCEGITSFFVESKQDLKFSVIVKKSDLHLSTTRHKIARRAYQALEEIIVQHPKFLGHYTFIMSKSTLTASVQKIQTVLLKHLSLYNS